MSPPDRVFCRSTPDLRRRALTELGVERGDRRATAHVSWAYLSDDAPWLFERIGEELDHEIERGPSALAASARR